MNYFSHLIHYLSDLETLLISIICVFIIIALVLFIIIIIYRSIKISDLNYIASVKEQYDELFMTAAFSDTDGVMKNIEKAKELNKKHLRNKRHARIITNELLNLHNSFSGEAKDNLQEIYMKAGFLTYSENKIKSNQWELVAQGIREVAAMKNNRIKDYLKHVKRTKNKLITENVQLSLVKTYGFAGLEFLNEAQEPISDWQQINLIEALKEYADTAKPDFTKWLRAKENTVVLFAIRLMRYFKQMDKSEALYGLLTSDDFKIKTEAIRTLAEFGDTEVLNQLIMLYDKETHFVRIEIIKAYATLSVSGYSGILPKWIKETDDMEIKKQCIESIISLNALDEFKLMCVVDEELQRSAETFINLHL